MVGQQGDSLSVVVFAKGETNWNNSVNGQLVFEGLARMYTNANNEDELPEEINEWYDYEEEAKENQLKMWQYGGQAGDSDYD